MITTRPIADSDLDFLRRLYASTRADEMARVPWDEPEKQAFLDMQFEAQHRFYRHQFSGAQFDLVLEDGQPIGRLYLDRREAEHRVIDIAVMPEHRGRGVGESLMRGVLDEAAAQGRAVRIHVEQNNRAMHLYARLGFQRVEDQGVYVLMEWRAEVPVAARGEVG